MLQCGIIMVAQRGLPCRCPFLGVSSLDFRPLFGAAYFCGWPVAQRCSATRSRPVLLGVIFAGENGRRTILINTLEGQIKLNAFPTEDQANGARSERPLPPRQRVALRAEVRGKRERSPSRRPPRDEASRAVLRESVNKTTCLKDNLMSSRLKSGLAKRGPPGKRSSQPQSGFLTGRWLDVIIS